jgi:MFS family permease
MDKSYPRRRREGIVRAVTGTTPPAAPAPQIAPDSDPRRWRMLALLALAEVLGMCAWFAGNAVAPSLASAWGLNASEVGGLTTAVQLGFVLGTAVIALANLADIIPARVLFAVCALLAGAANAALLVAQGYTFALFTRFATGACLAGVYPPAMKMAATWFRARRGLAVGTVVGALTVGKALPYLLKSFPELTATHIVLSASAATVIAAAFVWLTYHDGPYAFPSPRFSWTLVRDVLHGRRYRLALGGYLGHMAELYSYWTWIPAFLAASAMARTGTTATWVNALAFATVAIGGAGCVWGGLAADRMGRARLTIVAMAASGACALLVAASFGASWFIMAPLALAWGFFVIADSAQFSVLVTESVPPHAVGTALTLQTSLGFLLTTITIQLVPPIVDVAGWRSAFAMLAIGPVLGIVSIARLMRERAEPAR